MAFAVFEDTTVRKVLAVALNASQADPHASPPIVHLQDLEQELREEAAAGIADDAGAAPLLPLLLNQNTAERALMDRLCKPPAHYPQWPVHYLLGCYVRAQEESRNITLLKDPADQQTLTATLTLIRQLTVSYTGFIITMGMFPEPENASTRGGLQILDSLYAAVAVGSSSGLGGGLVPGSDPPIPPQVTAETQIVPMPASFLTDLALRFANEGFFELISTFMPALMQRLASVSLLGDYTTPLTVLERLLSCKPFADCIVKLPLWLPAPTLQEKLGRAVEANTILGPAFGISAIPDVSQSPLQPSSRLPDVVEQCFINVETQRPADVRTSMASVQSALKQLHMQLHRIVMVLLRNSDAKEGMMEWLAVAVHHNQERTKMRPNLKNAATDGFMLNVAAVAVKLCDPFLDPASGKAWSRLDARYASDPAARGRCFEDDTRLGATSEMVDTWVKSNSSNLNSPAAPDEAKKPYHFICEMFFLTGMALRVGFSKSMEMCSNVSRSGQNYLEDAEGAPAHQAGPMRTAGARLKGTAIAIDTCLRQEDVLNDVIGYYRLLAAYLLRLACPTAAAGGPPMLPLPEPAPMEFSSLPEFYVEDLCGALSWAGRARPDLVTSQRMEQYMLFFTVFMGSPSYVKNPYLRGKMVEALASYMPPSDDSDDWRPRGGAGRAAEEVSTLFQVHPLVIGHMVRALISLFVDIERTDRNNAFYEKFNMRFYIGETLGYLWKLPQHRVAWRQVAADDPKLYIRFVNFLLADSQHLLQEALDALPAVQETERLQGDAAAWIAMTPTERAERLQNLESSRRTLRSDFSLAEIYLKAMKFTSEDSIVAARFFDIQVRDRQARILNFFLRYLTLPAERRRLKLKDPERYGWRPKELISSLAAIHINLYRSNRTAWAEAVAADTDYYGPNPEIFRELAGVLRTLHLASPDDIADVEALAVDAVAAVANAVAEEEGFEDIPEEYEDSLLGGVMWDPVKLPSNQIVNRATILQQLLADQRDPFNRAPMTEEDLVECPELKAQIAAWVAEQRAKRKVGAATAAAVVMEDGGEAAVVVGAADGEEEEGGEGEPMETQ